MKDQSVIDELRTAIRDSGETEYGIGKAADVPQSVVNRFVNQRQGISLETAAKLCKHLGLSLVATTARRKVQKTRKPH